MRKGALLAVLVMVGCASATNKTMPPVAGGPPKTAQVNQTKGTAPSVPGFDCATARKESLACEKSAPSSARDVDDLSETVTQNSLKELMARIACAPPPTPHPREARWDHKAEPTGMSVIDRRFGVTPVERDHLARDGFVVPARLAFDDYATAYHDVYRSELPVYISVDSVLHAIYSSNDKTIANVESSALEPELQKVMDDMHAELLKTPGRYTKETARDLDLYLTVARKLGNPEAKAGLGAEDEALALAARVHAASGIETVNVFGRGRAIDFAQYKPRGHYASGAAQRNPWGADLSSYFRQAMWLSRFELNLVSRSSRSSTLALDPSETPREASLAIALVDLAERAKVTERITQVNAAWSTLAGPREDVSPEELAKLIEKARITDPASPDAPAALRAAIGSDFVRTARTHIQWEGTRDLPVIATMLGARIPPDASATRPLVHGAVPRRFEATGIDLAFALGHDRALAYEKEEIAQFPTLPGALANARAVMNAPHPERSDLYTTWLGAIRGLAEKPKGTTPSYMETEAFADMRVNSAIAAYGQIRHNYVLMVPVTYDEAGCEIPDSWVEPAPATYKALIDYADRAADAIRPFGEVLAERFLRMGRVLRVLARIGDRELAGEPLTEEERAFLAQVSEAADPIGPYGYEGRPHRRGWFYDLFNSPEDALENAKLVADYFVSVNAGVTRYAGVSGVRLGIFVVDTGGGPRAFVGPVSRAFQARGPIAPRYDDDDVGRFPVSDPWAKSYTAPLAEVPKISVTPVRSTPDGLALDVVTASTVRGLTLSLLDHHSVPIASATRDTKAGVRTRFVFPPSVFSDPDIASLGIEGLQVKSATFAVTDRNVTHYAIRDEEPAPVWKLGGSDAEPKARPDRRAHRGPKKRF